MKCPSCGNEIPNEARFCKKCGADVSAGGAAPAAGVPKPPPVTQYGPSAPKRPAPPQQPHYGTSNPSHQITQMKPGKLRGKLPDTKIIIIAAVVIVVVAAGIFFLRPVLFPGEKPPAPVEANVKTPAPQPPPETKEFKSLKPINEASLSEKQKQIASRMKEFFNADIDEKYVSQYQIMTPFLQNKLDEYYPGAGVKNSGTYDGMRNAGDMDWKMISAQLVGDIAITGSRAEATADATGTYRNKDIHLRINYVLMEKDSVWRVDGMAAGPDGPVINSVARDLDSDGQNEKIIFYADLLHFHVRWDIVRRDGTRVRTLGFTAECLHEKGTDEQARAALMAIAEKQPNSYAPGAAESAAFKEQFADVAKTRDFADALSLARPGFTIYDPCRKNTFYILYTALFYYDVILPGGEI